MDGMITEDQKDERVKEIKEQAGVNTVKLLIGSKENSYLDTITIDNKDYELKGAKIQSNKINDYQYQVYATYSLLTLNEITKKDELDIGISGIKITNGADISNAKENDAGMYFINGADNQKMIPIDKGLNIHISKSELLKNTKVLNDFNVISRYKNYNKSVEKVIIDPLQTMVKVDTQISDVSYQFLTSGIIDDDKKFGILYYEVYDQDMNDLNPYIEEVKREVIYENGKKEEWAAGQIDTYKNFKNATMNLKDVIVVKTDANIKQLIIKPYRTLGSSNNHDRNYFDDIIIELK